MIKSLRDNVRRLLINGNSSDESQASVPTNVDTEREYPYDAKNYSLIAPNNDNVANLRVEQINDLRRSDSFDGSLFGLNDVLQALNNEMAHTPERAPEAPIYNEIDEEILRLRNSLPRNDEAGSSRRVTFGDQRENVLIRELLQEIRELRMQLLRLPVNEQRS